MKYARRVQHARQARASSASSNRAESRVMVAPQENISLQHGGLRSGWLLAAVAMLALWLFAATTQAGENADANWPADCPAIYHQNMKQLHSSKVLNLCDVSQGKPVLLINTASHCGFTKQFGDLQAIHDKYKDQGLVVVGVASNSFNQEAKTEEEAARICRKNFGVTFTMLAPVPVKGDDVHPLFKELAAQSVRPKWNFYKYLLNADGQVVESWSSMSVPDDDDLRQVL